MKKKRPWHCFLLIVSFCCDTTKSRHISAVKHSVPIRRQGIRFLMAISDVHGLRKVHSGRTLRKLDARLHSKRSGRSKRREGFLSGSVDIVCEKAQKQNDSQITSLSYLHYFQDFRSNWFLVRSWNYKVCYIWAVAQTSCSGVWITGAVRVTVFVV